MKMIAATCRLCGKSLDLSGPDVSGDDAHQTCQQALDEGVSVEEVQARYAAGIIPKRG